MKTGDLVEMYGEPEFYGIVLGPARARVDGCRQWFVLWQNGFVFARAESLLEVMNEDR